MANDVLSFRDFEPPRPVPSRRLVYSAQDAADLDFDAVMAERRKAAGQEEPEPEGGAVEFGRAEDGGERAEEVEELVKDLVVPPPPVLYRGFARDLRPTAIFLTSKLFGLLPTGSILRWSASLGLRESDGLEWISDWTLCLVFRTREDCISGFKRLLLQPDEIEGENGMEEAFEYLLNPETEDDILEAAGDFVLSHRPCKPLTASLFTKNPLPANLPARDLLPFARFALSTDVKSLGARKTSMWYAVHGEQAGREGVSTKTVVNAGALGKRARDEEAELDAQMDAYRSDKPVDGRPVQNVQGRPAQGRVVRGLPKRARKPVISEEAKAAQLDDELDRFMRGGNRAAADDGGDEDVRRKKRRSSPGPGGADEAQRPTVKVDVGLLNRLT